MKANEVIKSGDKLVYNGKPYIVDAVNLIEWHFPKKKDCHDMKRGKVKDIDTIRLFPDGHSDYIDQFGMNSNEVHPWEVERCRHVWELSYDEMKNLRSQICVGSIYVKDYINDLGCPAKEVCDYSDGYCEWLDENETLTDDAENFADYCFGVEAA